MIKTNFRLLIALSLSLLARTPLIALPAAGRDEATYAYWAYHPEAAYSPLLQIFVRLFNWLPLPEIIQLRMTSIVMGSLSIVLFDMLLKRRNVSDNSRYIGVCALALSPWLIYSGSILHPDMLLLSCILAYMVAVSTGRFFVACFFAGLAFWAKLSGLVLLPAVLLLIVWKLRDNRRHALIGLLILSALILPIAAKLNLDLLMAISEFGKMDESIGFTRAVLIQIGQVVLLGGPALILGFVVGFGRDVQWKKLTTVSDERIMALVITASVFAAFGFAVIVTHQIKGNWLLPAVVLLWPQQLSSRKWFALGLMSSILISIALVLFFAFPNKMLALEKQLPSLAATYSLQAGTREHRVSATRSWGERVNEYRGCNDFAAEIRNRIDIKDKQWLVSDDYGLAAQLLWTWGRKDMKLIIPGDKLFYKHLRYSGEGKLILHEDALLLGIQVSLEELTDRQEKFLMLGGIAHPFSDGSVMLGCVRR